jgi:hypothetical protein
LPSSVPFQTQQRPTDSPLHSRLSHHHLRAHTVDLISHTSSLFDSNRFSEQTSLCQLSKTSKPLVSPTPLSAHPLATAVTDITELFAFRVPRSRRVLAMAI